MSAGINEYRLVAALMPLYKFWSKGKARETPVPSLPGFTKSVECEKYMTFHLKFNNLFA
jgi:hypothetical protein